MPRGFFIAFTISDAVSWRMVPLKDHMSREYSRGSLEKTVGNRLLLRVMFPKVRCTTLAKHGLTMTALKLALLKRVRPHEGNSRLRHACGDDMMACMSRHTILTRILLLIFRKDVIDTAAFRGM